MCDRICHDLLFELLSDKNVNPFVIKIVMDSYSRQINQTKWLNETSFQFKSINGVRQGGILSPLLYSIYNDVLIDNLRRQGHGCHKGDHFIGALSYADDLCILSPTIKGLQSMLNVCEEFSKQYDVLFNPKKTQCIHFTKKSNTVENISVYLCGEKLNWCSNIKHLGNWVSSNLCEKYEINRKCGILLWCCK